MSGNALEEAKKYELAGEKRVEKEDRPVFHLSPRIGWMNDPNGFSFHDGKYHLFYQYHPYNTYWGPMHWGHAVSKDMLNWEYLPVVMAPDMDYDYAGCFSGGAITLDDGKHLLIYTGVAKEKDENGHETDLQTQCIAIGDGVTYAKYEHNPVIDASKLPMGGSRVDFRDPHIFKENGLYKTVAVNRDADGYGSVLLFKSKDACNWEFEKVILHNDNGEFGTMWECPDYFELDGKQLLFISTMEMEARGSEFCNGYGNLCFIGHLDENGNYVKESVQTIDYGHDFYGQQSLLAPDGRRIMIGWMQNWDNINYRRNDCLWYGQMSLPREIFLKNNRLYQRPIREIDSLRKNKVDYSDILVDGEISLDGIEGRVLDMELTIRPETVQDMYKEFTINFAQDENHHMSLTYNPGDDTVSLDRRFAGSRNGMVHERKCVTKCDDGTLKLRIILDRYSAEVFINDGEEAMTLTFYTDSSAKNISFVADGKAKLDIEKYDLYK